MIYTSKTHLLKNGKQVIIKTIGTQDAQRLIDLKRNYIVNTITIPLTIDEYPMDLNREVSIIKDYNESANSQLLVAEYEGQFVGNIDLTGSKRIRMKHTGMIGMGIQKDWRNQGLGKVLMESIINWAKNESDIEVIWLDVYASNLLGLNLYKNTGFKVSGMIKGFFKHGNEYIDKVQMYQHIK